jgi:hypothetical protein
MRIPAAGGVPASELSEIALNFPDLLVFPNAKTFFAGRGSIYCGCSLNEWKHCFGTGSLLFLIW